MHLNDVDINLDKFHDYCIRVLNKTFNKETRKTSLLFGTLYLIEIIGDEFKNVLHHLIDNFKGKKLDALLELGEMVLEQFNAFYKTFYHFNQ